MAVTSCKEQTGKKRSQPYQYISASSPRSCSCRCQAEACQAGWRTLSLFHTAPGWTGSECLSRETQVGIKPQIKPGGKEGLSTTDWLRCSLGGILCLCRCTQWQRFTPGNNLKTAWFHSVPNKWRIPFERFHLGKSLLTPLEEGVRRVPTSVFSFFLLLPHNTFFAWGGAGYIEIEANKKIVVFTPLLRHAPCCGGKYCCRAAQSQHQPLYNENMETGGTLSVIFTSLNLQSSN